MHLYCNVISKQSLFFLTLPDLISEEGPSASDCKILFGGDLNVTLDRALDFSGESPSLKESVKFLL